MTRSLPDKPSISLLKKQAKKLLREVRKNSPNALQAVAEHHPKAAAFSGLRDAQLVIARGYGFAGWPDLIEAVELALDSQKNLSEKSALLIQLGCLQYSGRDTLRNYQRARRLLAANPEISRYSFYTALVANNLSAVSDYLQADPALASATAGPLDWPALLYVTYSRIGEPRGQQHSLSIIRQLLKCGASPDSHVILNDTYRFTALTGAMGEGEQGINQPPHQYADEIVALLLDAGANPNEGQGLYNTMFTDSADKWLALLLKSGLKASDPLNWNDSGNDAQVSTLDYQLSSAIDSNRLPRATLLLNAGANPDCRNTYNGRAIHTNALLAGHTTLVKLLEDSGAKPEALDVTDRFKLACVREDHDSIKQLLATHQTLKEDASLLHAAAEYAESSVVMALIAQGFDIDGQSKHGRTLLHHFALSNDTEMIEALLRLNARTDIRDHSYHSIAAGFAAYSAAYEAMRLLLDKSDSLLDAVSCAYLERAQAIVKLNPDAIHHRTEQGNTVLHVIGMWLHDEPEYDSYTALVEWLISAGADINAKNSMNQTPIEFSLANGSETLAELLSG